MPERKEIMKVLIIKCGFSETFTPEVTTDNVSLGDVLRSTALLRLYKGHHVTWLTSPASLGLLTQNKAISRLLSYDVTTVLQLLSEEFDIVINLEKVPGLCALTDRINAWQKYGFRFNSQTGRAEAFLHSSDALYLSTNEERKATNTKHWLEMLYEMVGAKWKGEEYILASPTNKHLPYCYGFNYRYGRKFENKGWNMENWYTLEAKILDQFHEYVSWQPTETTIEDYIEWINGCGTIVTNDSLGLHIAIALDKKVVGLFGPTPAKEIHPYDKGIMIQRTTMQDITVDDVMEALCIVKSRY